MALSAESLDLIIQTLATRLFTDKNSAVRIKAARSLAKLASEKAISPLCQALNREEDLEVAFEIIDAIIMINDLYTLPPMSDTPKYDLRGANIGSFADTVQGDQKSVQHNYAPPQNLAESAREIQELLAQLSRTYPTDTDTEKEIFVAQVNEEVKKNSRLRSILLVGGIELLKILCPPLGIPIEMGRKWLETARENQP
ncbi:HEAT repeat domain-containing protein [Pannus brasiliensis]